VTPPGGRAAGVALGLGAGALWALAFVGPAQVEPFGAAEITLGRFLVFGLCSVVVLVVRRHDPRRRLDRVDRARIVGLGLAGNTAFFLLLAAAVAVAGSAPVALVIGALPVAMAVVGNLHRRTVRWAAIAGPALVIAAGIAAAGWAAAVDAGGSSVWGLALAGAALASWLVYGLVGATYLASRPDTDTVLWTSLLGVGTVVTLPAVGLLVVLDGPDATPDLDAWVALVAWSVVLGVGSSWVATWMWSRASVVVPVALLGMLIASETVFAVLYAAIVAGRVPPVAQLVGAALIVGGVTWGARASRERVPVTAAPA